MKRGDIRVAIVRMEGTNCEEEMHRAFQKSGARPEMVHLKELASGRKHLEDYQCLMFPGGFSAGDYVRSGAIFASRLKSTMGGDLTRYVERGYPVGGVCNGFQVLVELGLLPALQGTLAEAPEAALATNDSGRFECRPTYIRHASPCAFTHRIPRGQVRQMPVAHGEGKLSFPPERQPRILDQLEENGQIVFRYTDPRGHPAGYPWNPSGTPGGITGICNPQGNVFGMMPHPERVYDPWTHQDWTRVPRREGDGRAVFESVLTYIEKKF
ncbi:MAG: phosphoribosylformylglycinamidine synthase subunit PurQ [Euryarchaeota archaeon]|nr:phosphoribosylformylglycinamidine synthase subunit PurQ [Euryarchaeota archaeon]